MSYRGNRGGRGEALRQLLRRAAADKPEELDEPPALQEYREEESLRPKPLTGLGRSAALAKLLETASGRGIGRSSLQESHSSTTPTREESLDVHRSYRGEKSVNVPCSFGRAESVSARTSFGRSSAVEQTSYSISGREQLPSSSRGIPKTTLSATEREKSPVRYTRRSIPPAHGIEDLERSLPSQLSVSEFSEPSGKPAVIKKGTSGTEFPSVVNYIRLNVEKGKGVFQYDVRFLPEVDSRSIRYKLLKEVSNIIGETKSFDGHTLYLPFRLADQVTSTHLKLPTDGSDVSLKITFVKKLHMGDSLSLHLYNVIFRKIMVILGLALHGRNFYDPRSAMPIPAHKLEVWPGYITAIQEFEDGVMLCCDASHRVLRTQTVYQLMEDMISSYSNSWKEEFIKLIVGQTVLTRYNNKVYRIDDVSFDESARDSFQRSDGSRISYADYYSRYYDIRITDLSQPLLKSRIKETPRDDVKKEIKLVSLIPELCYLTGLTDAMREDMRVMKDIAQCTRITPNQRQYALTEFVKNINQNEETRKILSSWGLSLASNAVKICSRTVNPENILFGNNTVHKGNVNADWTKTATSSHVLSAVDLIHWSIVCTTRDEKVVEAFVEMLRRCAPQLGLKVNLPQLLKLQNDNIQTYLKSLQTLKTKETQMAVIVFPISRTDKYNAVKRWCCVENPIPSQVILSRTIRKQDRLRSVTQKIALQINCKLGGSLWTVEIPLKNTIVIGLDTFHDPGRRGKSVGAVVASLNKPLSRWYSRVYSQAPGLELIDGLEVSILACLQKYKQVNGIYPEQILIYRDGVGDGQLDIVEKFEIPQIITACRRISPMYDPKFLVVIVQKRITTRIFKEEKQEFVNPPPGTVVDHTVTRKELWDFFLVSQSVRQGTVSPTHYIVLHNSTKMSPDQVQRFTYKLTHLYYNWSGTIRVPAPCQYAHKLAYLVGENIKKEADEALADKLFFL